MSSLAAAPGYDSCYPGGQIPGDPGFEGHKAVGVGISYTNLQRLARKLCCL